MMLTKFYQPIALLSCYLAASIWVAAHDGSGLTGTAPKQITRQVPNGVTVSPLSWNADPTCKRDSTAAWANMLASLSASPSQGAGTTIDLGYGCYLVGNVTLPQNVTIRGAMGYGDPFIYASVWVNTTATGASSGNTIPVASTSSSYGPTPVTAGTGDLVAGTGVPAGSTVQSISGLNVTLSIPPGTILNVARGATIQIFTVPGGVQSNPYNWGGQMRRIRGTTLTAQNGDRFSNLVFIRQGLVPAGVTFPLQNPAQASAVIANYGDDAIDSNQASVEVEHSTFLGFNYPLKALDNFTPNTISNGISSKVRFEYNLVDGNNGPYIGGSGDPNLVNSNHIFPFLTIAVQGVGIGNGLTATPMQRPGVGLYLMGPDTGSRVTKNLVFGYFVGGQCTGCSQPSWSDNHFENIGIVGNGSGTGLSLSGMNLMADHNFVIGYRYSVYLDGLTSPGTPNSETNISGSDTASFTDNQIVAPNPSGACLNVNGGWIDATGNMFQQCHDAVHIHAGSTGGIYNRNRFVTTGNPSIVNPFVFYNSSDAAVPAYAGTGNLVIKDNPGYNPVGPKTVTVSAGLFIYTAGPSPETVYLWAGKVTSVSISGRRIFVNPNGQIVELQPNETMSIKSSTAPTMVSDVH